MAAAFYVACFVISPEEHQKEAGGETVPPTGVTATWLHEGIILAWQQAPLLSLPLAHT